MPHSAQMSSMGMIFRPQRSVILVKNNCKITHGVKGQICECLYPMSYLLTYFYVFWTVCKYVSSVTVIDEDKMTCYTEEPSFKGSRSRSLLKVLGQICLKFMSRL